MKKNNNKDNYQECKQKTGNAQNGKEKNDMLTVKELIRNKTPKERKELSPLEIALQRFKDENGYSFQEMIENSKIRQKHKLKQMQKPDYDDDDFLEKYQDEQGE